MGAWNYFLEEECVTRHRAAVTFRMDVPVCPGAGGPGRGLQRPPVRDVARRQPGVGHMCLGYPARIFFRTDSLWKGKVDW